METIIVYVDDADFACKQVMPMLVEGMQTKWVLVGCPPKLNRHTGRWLTVSALKRWRTEWTNNTVADLRKILQAQGDEVTTRVANGSLFQMTRQLHGELGLARIVDARRPKFAHEQESVTESQPLPQNNPLALPASLLALGTVLAIAAE